MFSCFHFYHYISYDGTMEDLLGLFEKEGILHGWRVIPVTVFLIKRIEDVYAE